MKLMGHRGARHEAPENTLGGIVHALEAGVTAIEVDVHRAADGELVVIHDETVDRTTDGRGPVRERSVAELKALDAGGGERIPTLDEVLATVAGRVERLFVELKVGGCEAAVVEAVAARKATSWCLVKAFDHRIAARAKALATDLPTGVLIVGRPVDPVGLVRAAGADLLSISVHTIDADLVAACHEAGLEVCAWNCNDPAEVAGYRAMGVDWLGTDRPTTVVPAARSRP